MKKAMSIVALFWCGLISACLVLFVAPFISFGADYQTVAEDAARMYGLDINNYELSFSSKVVNNNGDSVMGLYKRCDGKESIQIKTSWSRPTVVATIFHEFAHASQHKYCLDAGEHTHEQHAELLSFSVMWQSNYWWDSLHLLPTHLFGKSAEYRIPNEIWQIMRGNTDTTNLLAFTSN